jgi:hypothetical protein
VSRGAIALVAILTLASCASLLTPRPTEEGVGCTLEPVTGTLRITGEQSFIDNPRTFTWGVAPGPLALQWPTGWRVGSGEIRSANGKVQASAGQQIAVYAVSDNGSPTYRNGAFAVCPQDVFVGEWPPT